MYFLNFIFALHLFHFLNIFFQLNKFSTVLQTVDFHKFNFPCFNYFVSNIELSQHTKILSEDKKQNDIYQK